MKRTISVMACLLLAGISHGIGGTYLMDTKTWQARPVVTSPVGAIRNPLGLKFDLNVDAYAGVNDFDRVVPGMWISGGLRAADNMTVRVGPALELNNGRVRCPGVMIGFTIHF